jgi:hypothetical protein
MLGAAGCGNAEHDFRVERLDPLVRGLGAERSRFGEILRLARPHQQRDARLLRAQVAAIATTSRRIELLHPPAGVEGAFHRLTRANTAVVSFLTRYVDAFAGGSVVHQREIARAAQVALSRAGEAQRALLRQLGP